MRPLSGRTILLSNPYSRYGITALKGLLQAKSLLCPGDCRHQPRLLVLPYGTQTQRRSHRSGQGSLVASGAPYDAGRGPCEHPCPHTPCGLANPPHSDVAEQRSDIRHWLIWPVSPILKPRLPVASLSITIIEFTAFPVNSTAYSTMRPAFVMLAVFASPCPIQVAAHECVRLLDPPLMRITKP